MHTTILIVDDKALELDLLEQELRDKGYEVERASGGEIALQKLKAIKPQAVLLDYMMPRMNGLEVLRRIHLLEAQTKVVLLTAYYTPELEDRAIKQGAEAVIPKPFDPEQLERTLQQALHAAC